MTLDVPRLKILVDKKFLTNKKENGLIEAYLFAVTLIESRPLLFTVHTIDGAVYSRIPIDALYTKKPKKILNRRYLDPWGAISSNGQVVSHQYLKDYAVQSVRCERLGRYLFTIDYFNGGFAEDPEEFKTSNVIALENGQICAWPNNYCLFKDEHFTESPVKTKYSRNKEYFVL